MTLVLLVVLILVLPPLTREVPLELPQPKSDARLALVSHRLVLARAGGVTLDGAPLTDAGLAAKLARIVADRQATLTLRTTRRPATSGSIRCLRWSSARG